MDQDVSFFLSPYYLPIIFVGLMALAIYVYVILDGYDLGIGMLMYFANDEEKDILISSIGPFWDANETWLVLAVGILLIAFPMAQGEILTNLYLPVALMLIGLILRGVSFDFRSKVRAENKYFWNKNFIFGSLLTSVSQGYMLGMYIVSFETSFINTIFSLVCGICVAGGYCLIGAAWAILKTEDKLQLKAIQWAKNSVIFAIMGFVVVSAFTPMVNDNIQSKWFSLPQFFILLPIPLVAFYLTYVLYNLLNKLPMKNDKNSWHPFVIISGIFLSCFIGLAYSFFPYIIPDKMTIWEAASAPESLRFILIGALIVVPWILVYTIVVYKIFWGKAKKLSYY